MALAATRPVVAVDIQEYSRVICASVLSEIRLDRTKIEAMVNSASAGDQHLALSDALLPLIDFERSAIKQAIGGDLDDLSALLDHGSILASQIYVDSTGTVKLREARDESIWRLDQRGLLNDLSSMVTRHFGGLYFSYYQAVQIDSLLHQIWTLPHSERDLYLAPLLSAVSDCVNTVGKHFAQPLRPRAGDGRPKRHLANKIFRDRELDVTHLYRMWSDRYAAIEGRTFGGEAFRADYSDFLREYDGRLSAIYADPPYTRDHYSRYYHVLETICLRDDPSVTSTAVRGPLNVSRGIYRRDRHQSPFCIQTKAGEAFETLIRSARSRDVPLLLSYSPFEKASGARPRLMSIENITKIGRKHFGKVSVVSAGKIVHSKLRGTERSVKPESEAELFIVCEL